MPSKPLPIHVLKRECSAPEEVNLDLKPVPEMKTTNTVSFHFLPLSPSASDSKSLSPVRIFPPMGESSESQQYELDPLSLETPLGPSRAPTEPEALAPGAVLHSLSGEDCTQVVVFRPEPGSARMLQAMNVLNCLAAMERAGAGIAEAAVPQITFTPVANTDTPPAAE